MYEALCQRFCPQELLNHTTELRVAASHMCTQGTDAGQTQGDWVSAYLLCWGERRSYSWPSVSLNSSRATTFLSPSPLPFKTSLKPESSEGVLTWDKKTEKPSGTQLWIFPFPWHQGGELGGTGCKPRWESVGWIKSWNHTRVALVGRLRRESPV